MTRLVLRSAAFDSVRVHGETMYPEECCGFLIGETSGSKGEHPRVVPRVVRAANQVAENRERRFLIPPEDLLRVERSLEGTTETILGFYHSHPDHPALPSRFDAEHAWPWYSYLILSVRGGRAGPFGAFEMGEDGRELFPIRCEIDSGSESTARPQDPEVERLSGPASIGEA